MPEKPVRLFSVRLKARKSVLPILLTMYQGFHFSQISPEDMNAAFADWRDSFPQAGILALLPEAEGDHVELLQAAARRHGLPLIGALFPALIAQGAFRTSGAVLLRFDTCPPWLLVDQLDVGDAGAGMAGIRQFIDRVSVGSDADNPATLFLTFDGLLPNIGTLLNSIYRHAGNRLRYAGVNAGSETFQPVQCLFDQDRRVAGGCIAMLIPSTVKFAVEHCYPVSHPIFRATSSFSNRIEQIDGKPAMAVYQQLLKTEFGVEVTAESFYQHAVHYPLGLISAHDVLVRIPVGVTEDGSIYCIGEIPPRSYLRLLHAPELGESRCVSRISARLGAVDAPLAIFYCAGRRMHFGADAEFELHELAAACGRTDVLGALSLGEIGTDAVVGMPEFHNAALVCMR